MNKLAYTNSFIKAFIYSKAIYSQQIKRFCVNDSITKREHPVRQQTFIGDTFGEISNI